MLIINIKKGDYSMLYGLFEMVREGNSATVTALSTAATNVVSEITSVVTTVAPIGLGILSVTLALYFGIRFIKRIAH